MMSKLITVGLLLIGLGLMVWVGQAFYVFGLGHAEDPASPGWMLATGLAVLGPIVLGAALILVGIRKDH